MPVTILPAPHDASPISPTPFLHDPSTALLEACLQDKYREVFKIKETSFSALPRNANISPSRNGLVQCAIDAYSYHRHLRLRPEDIWFAILSQLSKYINAHAEALRGQFVSHAGRMKLAIMDEASFGQFATMMGGLIQQNVRDPGLREWIMPGFSTTTETDVVVASVIMMAQLQRYFEYEFDPISCGLPSVTLLGQKADWEAIETRLGKLAEFGDEPAQWLSLLRPVLKRMVMSFDDPTGEEVLLFWNHIAHYMPMGSGSDAYSGWITAFCFWDDDGKCLYNNLYVQAYGEERATEIAAESKWEKGGYVLLCLDGVFYPEIDTQKVPTGYASVPVQVCENGVPPGVECVMIAGSVGIEVSDVGVPNMKASESEVEPVSSKIYGRSTWKPFTSCLMAVCQFTHPRATSAPKPTRSSADKQPPSTTKTREPTRVKKDVLRQSSAGGGANKDKSTVALKSIPKEMPQLSKKTKAANLQMGMDHLGETNSQRSSAVFSYDPATESFGAGSTIVGKQATGTMSEPTAKDEADTIEEVHEGTSSATPKKMFREKGPRDVRGKAASEAKGAMDTVSPVTGWWIYQKK